MTVLVVLNSYGAHGNPGEVIELAEADAAPMLAFGTAHLLDPQLEETRRSILDAVPGAAALLPPEPLRAPP